MEPGWLRRTRIGMLAALCICSLFGHARAALVSIERHDG